MDKLSEEEIMKILKDTINLFNNDTYCFTHSDDERAEAIQGLLDLYNKEKEKNKILEELLQGRLFELYKYYKDLASEYQANCISKNKIKPIQIIDLDGKIHNVYKIEEE